MRLLSAIALGCLLLALPGEDKTATKRHPVPVNYFLQGDTLMPSYACPDTLIVVDAAGLNKQFAYVEQSIDWGTDADIDSLSHQYCVPIDELDIYNPFTVMLP